VLRRDPGAKEGRPLRAILGDRLDQTAAALEGEAVGDPLVVARLQDRLGQTYLGLGHAAKAEALFTKAVATRQAELGADHPLTLASQHNQGLAYEAAGRRIEAIRRFEHLRAGTVVVTISWQAVSEMEGGIMWLDSFLSCWNSNSHRARRDQGRRP
jgi:hypothetical protein